MKCSIQGCPGEYENLRIVHTERHNGRLVVMENVPAEVCSVCGDILLKPETIRHIEELLSKASQPHKTVPLYEYA
ncbi:MAG: YgiT-type zinc finger protein [Nitrospinae bacterium]|nr:YgiT-type zinc finger protein [Nitrospinota bacterium]